MSTFSNVFLILLLSPTFLIGQVLKIDQSVSQINLGTWISYHTDTEKQYDIEDVLEFDNKDWNIFNSNNPSLSGESAYHWVKFTVNNTSESELNLFLCLEYAHYAEYQLFIYHNEQIDSSLLYGDDYYFSKRAICSPYFLHKINFEPSSTYQIFIKFDQKGQNLPLPLFLRSESNLSHYNINRYLFHGIFIGVIFIISLFIIFIYCKTGLGFLLLEALVLLLSILYVISEEGYGFMYIWGNVWPDLNGYSRPFTVGVITILNLYVSSTFLGIKKKSSRQFKLIIILSCLLISYMILFHPLFLLPIKSENNYNLLILIFLVLITVINMFNTFIVLYAFIKYKNKDAIVLLFVYALVAITVLARSLYIVKYVSLNIIAQHSGIIVLTFHCIIIGGYMIAKGLQIFDEKQRTILKLSENKRKAAVSMLQSLKNERERISMDIHDGLGSLLSGVSLNIQSLKEKNPQIEKSPFFENSLNYISQLDEEMRNISHNLMPKSLKEFGLIYAINKLIKDQDKSIKYKFEYRGFANRLNQNVELELYRMILEMIDNINKHSKARNVLIQLNKYSEEINLIVEDDGKGFKLSDVRRDANGIRNLKNRVKLLNGSLDFYPKLSEGTSISLNIPIPN